MTQQQFEFTVLAYLDGALDRREEHAFLLEVRRDPEKRALLEQYRRLDRVLEHQRASYPPSRTESALAERIPVLRNIPAQQQLPVADGSAGLLAFPSRVKRSLLLIAGGLFLAALITVLMRDLIPGHSVTDPSPDTSLPRTEEAVGSGTDNKLTPYVGTHDAPLPGDAQVIRDTPSRRDAFEASRRDPPLTTEIVSLNETPGLLLHDGVVPVEDEFPAPVAVHEISPFHMAGAREPLPPENIHPVLQELFASRLQVYAESGTDLRTMRRSDRHSANAVAALYLVGFRWSFAPSVAAGVEFGSGVATREVLTARTTASDNSPEVKVIVMENVFEDTQLSWLRAHFFWTLNPSDLLQLQATAGSGILFGSGGSLLFSTGLAAQYPLSSMLSIRAGVHYGGTWLEPSDDVPLLPPNLDTGPTGIKRPPEDPGRTYNGSLQFRIGAGYLLW